MRISGGGHKGRFTNRPYDGVRMTGAKERAGIALTRTCGHPSPAYGRGAGLAWSEHGEVALELVVGDLAAVV